MVGIWRSTSWSSAFPLDNASIAFPVASTTIHLIVAFFWSLRFCIDGHELRKDVKYIAVLEPVVAWSYRHDLLSVLEEKTVHLPWRLVLFIAILSALVCIVKPWRRSVSTQSSNTPAPYLLPCRTTHARLFPKKHAFSYSYLQLAIHVPWRGSVGRIVAVDQPDASTWFAIRGEDYLARGKEPRTLKEKLDSYLLSQDIDPSRYDSAWLVTAPRFLGYCFNPVSFWYMYRGEQLEAMILEVNNTFDERRPYFLPQGHGLDDKPLVEDPSNVSSNGNAISTTKSDLFSDAIIASKSPRPSPGKFAAHWSKDFHVSPFSSRKGDYSLSAQAPEFSKGRGISNTITLISSQKHTKLVARTFSTSAPISASHLSTAKTLIFVVQWFWVGFATYPRIVFEAFRLFFHRKLHVWYRPEVTPTSLSRNETKREAVVEACFRKFLGYCVAMQKDKEGLSVRYVAAGNALPSCVTFRHTKVTSHEKESITLHTLTPLFYAEIAMASNLGTYLRGKASQPVEERTFTCSDIDGLVRLLCTSQANALAAFVDRHVPELEAKQYRRVARALRWADSFVAGYPEVLDMLVSCARGIVMFEALRAFTALGLQRVS